MFASLPLVKAFASTLVDEQPVNQSESSAILPARRLCANYD
jgi:hypothetical protein